MSFGRFMRGLRMGLGNRHGDSRVAEALALFKGKAFRNATMPELYAITEKLREIFQDEIKMLELLDQHGTTAGEAIAVPADQEAAEPVSPSQSRPPGRPVIRSGGVPNISRPVNTPITRFCGFERL